MSLISQADPYEPEPLEDSPEEVARIAELAASGTPYQSQMSSLAGKWYAEFVHEINDSKEAKELALIQLAVCSDNPSHPEHFLTDSCIEQSQQTSRKT
jgi:hypothetical protein